MKALYDRYIQDDKDGVSMEDFTAVTMEDLYRAVNIFETTVCVYKDVELDEAGKIRPLFIDHCVTTPTRCTRIYMRRTSPI